MITTALPAESSRYRAKERPCCSEAFAQCASQDTSSADVKRTRNQIIVKVFADTKQESSRQRVEKILALSRAPFGMQADGRIRFAEVAGVHYGSDHSAISFARVSQVSSLALTADRMVSIVAALHRGWASLRASNGDGLVWCHGDVHADNFGRLPTSSLIVFDLDDAVVARPEFDLGQVLANYCAPTTAAQFVSAAEALISTYRNPLSLNCVLPYVLASCRWKLLRTAHFYSDRRDHVLALSRLVELVDDALDRLPVKTSYEDLLDGLFRPVE